MRKKERKKWMVEKKMERKQHEREEEGRKKTHTQRTIKNRKLRDYSQYQTGKETKEVKNKILIKT
jgi:hypothetical protein